MPKLSVVIPVFGAEAYLETCVNSVLAQDFSDFELILIDDGSRDKSGDICDTFAKIDARVRVVHTENRGMAAARNRGMDLARGEFLTFLDSDDFLESGAFSFLIRTCEETSADLVLCGYLLDAGGAGVRKISMSDRMLGPESYGASLAELKAKNLIDPPWNKLYRMAFLREAGVKMPQGEPFEDTDFNLRLLLAEPKIAVREAAFYHYMQRLIGNVTRRYHPQKLEILLKRADLLETCAERFPAPGLAGYCAFYRIKSVFSAFADLYLPDSGFKGRARREKIAEAMQSDDFRQAAQEASACSAQDRVTRFVARSGKPWLVAGYCRLIYLLKYKAKNLFFKVKK